MDVKFHYQPAGPVKPVVFETIFAEKNGGGLLANCDFDAHEGMAVGLVDGKYMPIKAYKLYEDAANDATNIKIEKGSGIAEGDVIGVGKKAVACTGVEETADYDIVTVALTVAVKKGQWLYQAANAGTNATPKYAPAYILGTDVPAGTGDAMVKLVNGANIRKETAPVADEVVALMKGIAKI